MSRKLSKGFAGDPKGHLIQDYCHHLRQRSLRRARILAERARRMEAERAAQLKANFIATMSHELRTPLNAIIGFANLLVSIDGRSHDPAKVEESANYIREAGQQLLETINKMLEISKIQSGNLRFEADDIDLNHILLRCCNMLRLEADGKGIALTHGDLSAGLGAIGDETRTAQVINNLISNAIKYNKPGGGIDIRAGRTESGVAIVIADTGIGMTPEELDVALTPFGRVQSVYTQAVDGTGLGLCIAKELMEFQGGRFDIASEKDKGTTVTLTFQARKPGSLHHHAA